MKILNLTQHYATPEQVKAGVVEPEDKKAVLSLLTFEKPPTNRVMIKRASILKHIAKSHGATHAMIGGAPYFMGRLELQLADAGITPLYSFTERTSVEKMLPDGGVEKVAVFKHVGWVGGFDD